ncbi:MAG: hypothetical protein A3J59_03970 [Candidatus Buchananbacteria bacterium RIFCSPHIGHO2_02_FULL_56_16]|uniref:Uncharacterized protein n=1 Tax=Candidatus Buchananbacteria bacterium RIFCSPHIGHO2_02_FULL_56_16 TaxID=1797542 RepID=A0A1G1YI85_9BACT|nr:MAG: hypothetical protein A3J59_03970 [Candidatus Buchananbacteria bacterium RIFCSPHIGHO2_02_FULL_56_16]
MKKNRYKLLWICGGLIGAILVVVAGWLVTHPAQPAVPLDYYQELAVRCEGDGCCEASAREMAQGSFRLAAQNGCRQGYQANSLKCPTSYHWCEPPSLAQ